MTNEESASRPANEGETRETSNRLEETEDRLAAVEEEDRLQAIEARLDGLEDDEGEREPDQEEAEGEGQKALRLALAGLLNNETIVQASTEMMRSAGQAAKDWAGLKTKSIEAEKHVALRTYYASLGFSAFLLLMLCFLLWHDLLNKELAAGLLGSLIGYWYGREKPRA